MKFQDAAFYLLVSPFAIIFIGLALILMAVFGLILILSLPFGFSPKELLGYDFKGGEDHIVKGATGA